jgi:hypothetical protein
VKIAAITNVRHDHFFTKLWLNHYASLTGSLKNCFVFIDGNDWTPEFDLSATNAMLMRKRVTGRSHSDVTANENHMKLAHQLLIEDGYDIVIRADIDEFLCPDPKQTGNFKDYVQDAFEYGYLYVNGMDMVHNVAAEGPYDPANTIMSQRHHALLWSYYFKPMIYTRRFFELENMRMIPGNHHILNGPLNIHPGLFMIHLALFDKDFEVTRNAHKLERRRYKEYLDIRKSIFDLAAVTVPEQSGFDDVVKRARYEIMHAENGDLAWKPQRLRTTNFTTAYEFAEIRKMYVKLDNRFEDIL